MNAVSTTKMEKKRTDKKGFSLSGNENGYSLAKESKKETSLWEITPFDLVKPWRLARATSPSYSLDRLKQINYGTHKKTRIISTTTPLAIPSSTSSFDVSSISTYSHAMWDGFLTKEWKFAASRRSKCKKGLLFINKLNEIMCYRRIQTDSVTNRVKLQ